MADQARIEELERRLRQDPASIAFAQLGEEYRRAGRIKEAIAICRAGLVRHPGYLSARVTLGRALLEAGDLDAAQQELGDVRRVAPENLAAIRGLAEVHRRRGELPEALEQYRTAFELAQNDPGIDQIVKDLRRQIGPSRRPAPPGPPAPARVGWPPQPVSPPATGAPPVVPTPPGVARSPRPAPAPRSAAAPAAPGPAPTPPLQRPPVTGPAGQTVAGAALPREAPAAGVPPAPFTPAASSGQTSSRHAPAPAVEDAGTVRTRRVVLLLERWLEGIVADRRTRIYGTQA
ncbi:MAG: tetratricopeptide repeat protein [Acidobacteriota bacterium]